MKLLQTIINICTSLSKWMMYSGASIAVTLNPLHWSWLPRIERFDFKDTAWASPNGRTWSVSWLFLTIRGWVDNGDW